MVKRIRQRKNKKGAALLEMAIVVSLLVWLTVGGAWLIMLLRNAQYVTNAVRYGARIAVRADATIEDVNNAIADLLGPDRADISNWTLKFYRADTDPPLEITNLSVEVGIPIMVKISVPHGDLAGIIPFVTKVNWDLVASNTLTKEGP
jgi:hypothetical protein